MSAIFDIEQNYAEILLQNGYVIRGYGLVIAELPIGDTDEYEEFLDFELNCGGFIELQDKDIKSYKLLEEPPDPNIYGKQGFVYGDEYSTVFQSGNIKFVISNFGSNTAPLETRTEGRVYVTIDKKKNTPKYISYYEDGMRVKQIHLDRPCNGLLPHVHHGYEHNEYDGRRGATKLTKKEQKMVDRIQTLWYNHINGK